MMVMKMNIDDDDEPSSPLISGIKVHTNPLPVFSTNPGTKYEEDDDAEIESTN